MSSPAKKVAKVAKPAAHPTYAVMVRAAITALKERSGSSRQAIKKYIMANYTGITNIDVHLKIALRRMATSGALKQKSGTGASGSFRTGEKPKVAKKAKKPKAKKPKAKKPKAKKPKAKKPKAKKAAAKKPAAKKPAAKKTAKKPAAKKPAAKKPAAKKPAAKKPAAKKAPAKK